MTDEDIAELIRDDIFTTAVGFVRMPQWGLDPAAIAKTCRSIGVEPDPVLALCGHVRRARYRGDRLIGRYRHNYVAIYDERERYSIAAVDPDDEQLMACLALRRYLDRRPVCRIEAL